jgi:hypothetical protein
MSNLLEFGGTGQVIATAICDFSINDKYNYKTGDIVFDFDDIYIKFYYNHKTSQGRDQRTQVFYEEFYLDSLSIDVVPFDDNFKLFCDPLTNTVEIYEVETGIAMNNRLFLHYEALPESIRIPGIQEFTVSNSNGFTIIESAMFIDQNNYKVYYQRQLSSNNIILDNSDVNIPYLKLQIKFKGNNDKQESCNYITIPKSAIRFTPIFNLQNNNVSHVRLAMKVIGNDKVVLSVI